ncbi:hypothetical protein VB711_26275 [Cronbergia sp. UHCC 0137]|uniref:hypothetical protein n=1 Tax=Cronbergia sp. UHCC 0137 TaxID=3110239 RepID=UPI002B1F2A3D|nr:hypothetical protein [Cronbergia sp. UHCC 0137]MEA5621316.1 hypothetical protein [Cronbergia sp. UHCC 0137]
MLNTSGINFFKPSNNSSMNIKKILFSVALSLTYLYPSMALAQYDYEIQQLLDRREDYKIQAENLQTKIGFYMLTNPKASAALLISGVGIFAILEQSLDPTTKVLLAGMGIVGTNYCLNQQNFQHCAKVATDLTSYAVEINNYNQQINSITRRIDSLQKSN